MMKLFTIEIRAIFTAFLLFGLLNVQNFAQMPQNQTSELKSAVETDKKSFVMLELFTSEGCPTCPPADANLAFLEKEQPFADTEIVTLALHVDYWNSVTWKDIYSSPLFSRRQQLYSQALKINQSYTPQMIVDGQIEFAGNNMAKAQKAILDAAKTPKANIEIVPATDSLKIKISQIPAHENATVFLAVTENKLISNRRDSKKTGAFPEHTSVVRNLTSLGSLSAAQNNLEIEAPLAIQPNWKKENLKIAVFVQENASRKILGVRRLNLFDLN